MMAFLQPLAWLAAFSLLAIVILYMLKKRTRPLTVSSIMLWQRLDRLRTPALNLSRLLRSLLLFLQLLVAALLVLALVRPAVEQLSAGGSNIIIIVDTSMAMAVEEGRGTRLEQSVEHIRAMVESKMSGDSLALIAASEEAAVVSGITGDTRTLLAALESLEVTGTRFNMADALILAGNMARAVENAEIFVFSAGRCEPVTSDADFPVTWVAPAKGEVTNLALEQMVMDGNQLIVTVYNNGTTSARGTVQVFTAQGQLTGQREVELAPGGRRTLIWRNPEPSPWYRGVLATADMVALDNEYYVSALPAGGTRLLLVTSGNLFLERALMLNSDIVISRVTPENYREEMAAGYDFFVFDGFLPQVLPVAPLLVFDPPHPNPHFSTTAPAAVNRLAAQDHPLLVYTDFTEVMVGFAKALSGGKVLLAGDIGPLAVVFEGDGPPRIVFGFAVQAGNFPLRPAFPIFIRNVVDYFTQYHPLVGQLEYGRPAVLEPPPGIEEMALVDPLGNRMEIVPPFPWRGPVLMAAGMYSLESETGTLLLPVNPPAPPPVLTVAESLSLGSVEQQAASRTGRLAPILTPLLLAAVVLMALEWWVDNNG